ncbi:MMB_0454 family protein [Mesoplasma coleopterae]|uniref:Uncharacterized protein n=1 Tax=Mesoplasma coleopterae TaxID=324078 RepID=A0A2K8P2M8_9MOLU|nr:hypothetical protein [Mesoplasma coleopterae]ATZ20936.1 hypothetical protein MCOLE_v1c04230 [Mesoplasma coleopterae]AVN62430.1 hypothetical protein CG001_02135 [Mesoplasma coleopterae]AVN63115.1 hypothetical protein CG000_02285 [Mesoplasma coleopterae]
MYISIERNNRGALEIEVNALNKLIQNTILMRSNSDLNNVDNIEVLTDLYHDNLLYVLIKIDLKNKAQMLEENQINKIVEEIIVKTLSIKPKNIAIAYKR